MQNIYPILLNEDGTALLQENGSLLYWGDITHVSDNITNYLQPNRSIRGTRESILIKRLRKRKKDIFLRQNR